MKYAFMVLAMLVWGCGNDKPTPTDATDVQDTTAEVVPDAETEATPEVTPEVVEETVTEVTPEVVEEVATDVPATDVPVEDVPPTDVPAEVPADAPAAE
jgi:hypothetical protein